jgi:hypothetical protein
MNWDIGYGSAQATVLQAEFASQAANTAETVSNPA